MVLQEKIGLDLGFVNLRVKQNFTILFGEAIQNMISVCVLRKVSPYLVGYYRQYD